MIEERRIASETGSVDPINESYEKTTGMYNSVLDFLLPLVQQEEAGIIVASHNENTIKYAMKR